MAGSQNNRNFENNAKQLELSLRVYLENGLDIEPIFEKAKSLGDEFVQKLANIKILPGMQAPILMAAIAKATPGARPVRMKQIDSLIEHKADLNWQNGEKSILNRAAQAGVNLKKFIDAGAKLECSTSLLLTLLRDYTAKQECSDAENIQVLVDHNYQPKKDEEKEISADNKLAESYKLFLAHKKPIEPSAANAQHLTVNDELQRLVF